MSTKTWSSEQESELTRLYTVENRKDIHELANHFDKGYRSVISKLVQLKIYEKPVIIEDKSQTVKLMIRDLEEILNIDILGTNLNKKENLVKVMKALKHRLGIEDSNTN